MPACQLQPWDFSHPRGTAGRGRAGTGGPAQTDKALWPVSQSPIKTPCRVGDVACRDGIFAAGWSPTTLNTFALVSTSQTVPKHVFSSCFLFVLIFVANPCGKMSDGTGGSIDLSLPTPGPPLLFADPGKTPKALIRRRAFRVFNCFRDHLRLLFVWNVMCVDFNTKMLLRVTSAMHLTTPRSCP